MFNFLNLKSEAFGLDISDFSLKIAKLKKKGKFLSLASYGEGEIPPGIIKNGEIRDEVALAKIIKKTVSSVEGEKLKTKYVVASLPEEKSFLQVIQMPKIPLEDLKSAVIYEAENYIPFPIEEVYLDFQIVPSLFDHLDHYDILINALPKKVIDPYLNSLKMAGLIPKVLEIESSAIARALIKNGISSSPVILIDLGATRTGFAIFSGSCLRFTTSISVSSQDLTKIIAKKLNLDLKKADEIKIKYGLGTIKKIHLKEEAKDKDFKFEKEIIEDKKILEAVIPLLIDLAEQIKKYIEYYQTHITHEHLPSNQRKIEKIYLSGGGASLKGLVDFLSLELKIDVELGNPWINILPSSFKKLPVLSRNESLGYTTALGLALRGIIE